MSALLIDDLDGASRPLSSHVSLKSRYTARKPESSRRRVTSCYYFTCKNQEYVLLLCTVKPKVALYGVKVRLYRLGDQRILLLQSASLSRSFYILCINDYPHSLISLCLRSYSSIC